MSTERIAALGNSAPRPTYEFEGATYTFGLVTQSLMAAMEAKLLDKKIELLTPFRPLMEPEAFQKKVDALHTSAEKELAFESPAMDEYLQTVRGSCEILALLMGATEDAVLRMLQTDGERINLLFKQVAERSKSPSRGGGTGPKAKARPRS